MFQESAGKPGTGIRQVFTHEQIVAMGGDPEAFLALEAAEGWAIGGGTNGDAISPATGAGEHGYLPERQAMRTSLLAYGPAIRRRKVEMARVIRPSPTLAR